LAYAAAHGYTQKGPTFNWYIDDPGSVAAEKLRTEVYVPIEQPHQP
jgi:effector-binding domain-containing protein